MHTQPFSFLESEINTEIWAGLIALGCVSVAFLAGWCMRPDEHTDDDEQADYLLAERIKQMTHDKDKGV